MQTPGDREGQGSLALQSMMGLQRVRDDNITPRKLVLITDQKA